MVTLSLIKEARIYNGEKTASSISGAGKTGHIAFKRHILTKNHSITYLKMQRETDKLRKRCLRKQRINSLQNQLLLNQYVKY